MLKNLFRNNDKNIYSAPSHLKNLLNEADYKIKPPIYEEYGNYVTIFTLKKPIIKLEVNWIEEYDCSGGIVYATDSDDNKFLLFNSLIFLIISSSAISAYPCNVTCIHACPSDLLRMTNSGA